MDKNKEKKITRLRTITGIIITLFVVTILALDFVRIVELNGSFGVFGLGLMVTYSSLFGIQLNYIYVGGPNKLKYNEDSVLGKAINIVTIIVGFTAIIFGLVNMIIFWIKG